MGKGRRTARESWRCSQWPGGTYVRIMYNAADNSIYIYRHLAIYHICIYQYINYDQFTNGKSVYPSLLTDIHYMCTYPLTNARPSTYIIRVPSSAAIRAIRGVCTTGDLLEKDS